MKYIFPILTVLLAATMLIYVITNIKVEVVKEPTKMSDKVLWGMVQDWRVDNGHSAYMRDDKLCSYAESRIPEIKQNWSHDGFKPDKDGLFDATGYKDIGENLAKGFDTEQKALQGWLNSPTHKANLDHDYQFSCVVCADGYCVQEFGSY